MNKAFLWFYLSFKRHLKRPFFAVLLLLLPVGMYLFDRVEEEGSGKIAIALYTEADEWNEQVAGELMREPHSFEFYLCTDREELLKAVAAGDAECGYIFPQGLREKLENGSYKRSIAVVTSPSTVTAQLASETVFAGLFRVYGRELLRSYSENGAAFQAFRQEVWAELEPIYDGFLEDGSTFSFAYATADGGVMETASAKVSFPIRGIAAVFIFVMGLAAAVTACEDEKRGLFLSLSGGRKAACMMAQLSAPVALACLSAFFCLQLTGSAEAVGGPGCEITALVIYGIIIVLFSYVLLRIVGNPLALAGLIPFFIIGSLTACPIFADLSAFVPVLSIVRYFLPPFYYLMM